ncbi:RNA 2',3'-cyclic phosphodiesterase [Methanobrevibacter boviskoreani]|uniref:RNA 2',3'-cyclic phosphodiesterase n=1 Tax=Methanobrevibacter boviskoreani TaxID=1348249 RepID=UPI0023A7F92F|nr:RNA 2',3'-cyclic phosphodiesterase [Methanobrevibacter boviskoreani]MCI6775234.1 RNA 2',3'-cyclic phosphodiesterase [Methanobrevibacter boviskoreani]MDY5614638.1 RNA 2',3'-cyclic phosphodiesterase [Methanobrevibacter boviskoreani]
MSDNIRSFLAIEVDENLLKKINTIEDDFKQIDTNIKYVPSKNMHFTLKFFGNIDLEMIDRISKSIEKVIKNYKPFELKIKGSGAFPNEKRIKVIWIGIEENPELKSLQKELDHEFNKLGFNLERNYISHLTIGRMKSGRNKNQVQNKIRKYRDYEIGDMCVRKIYLKKSTLTPNGPIYENIKEFNL